MAQRRMFSLEVCDTDSFLDMPASTQALYFHLGLRADDRGFVGNPKKITAMVNCSGDDLKLLIAKGYLIPFESGVCVIRDWRINNYIQKDRFHETRYLEEKSMLQVEENQSYTLDTTCIQNVSRLDTEVRLGKSRASLELGEGKEADKPPTPSRRKYGQYGWVKLTEDEYNRLLSDLGQAELDRCIQYIDMSAQSNGNKNRWKDWNLMIRRCSREGWGNRFAEQSTSPPSKPRRYRTEIIDGEEVAVEVVTDDV